MVIKVVVVVGRGKGRGREMERLKREWQGEERHGL